MTISCAREVFYVGGHYVKDDASKHTMEGQMYVERLEPALDDPSIRQPHPVVFIHGGTRNGAVSQACILFGLER